MVVCSHPPGLRDEPAEHIVARNMGAGGSHPQAEMMQLSSSANLLLPTGKGFFNLAGTLPWKTTNVNHASTRSSNLDRRDTQFLRQGNRKGSTLHCGSSSQIRSAKSCGEVETTGKHAPRKKSVSKGRRRKRGGSAKDGQMSNGRRGRSSRRSTSARSGT